MPDEKRFLDSLATLPQKKQLAFALLVFERLLPDLVSFSKDTGQNISDCLGARDAVWTALQENDNRALNTSLNEACLRNAPDTEAFSHELTSSALNAVLAMSDLIEFALDGHHDHVVNISTLARDSVYLYVSNREPSIVSSPEEDVRIAIHPLMQQELLREEEDVEFLSYLPDQFDSETISLLRERASLQAPILPVTR